MITFVSAPDYETKTSYKLAVTASDGTLSDTQDLGKDYSITLFHYRNHGAAYGRILVGMQVPSGKRASLRSALNRLGYRFWDETDNPAYREHLGRTTT